MGALYHLKQKLVDFCNVIQENVSRTDTVPSSKVVYDLKADTDGVLDDIGTFVSNTDKRTVTAGTRTQITSLCPINVEAGSYIAVGTMRFTGTGRYYIETAGDYVPQVRSSGSDPDGYTGGCVTVAFRTPVATTVALTLYVSPAGSGSVTVDSAMYVVRIK